MLAGGCVFHPPPPLPEELAEHKAAVNRVNQSGAETGEGAEEANVEFAPGDLAPIDMTPAQMRAYAEAQGDPQAGDFTLDEALVGLPGDGELWARLRTSSGEIACKLFEDQAPATVANFVGLARGLRPNRTASGEWVAEPFFDGNSFHRVIPGFMIQAGQSRQGQPSAGYVIADEILGELTHDQAGVLSMANRGAGTGSTQFFITLGPAPHLNGRHTIFGQCTPQGVRVAEEIAATATDENDRPLAPQTIETVTIERRGADGTAIEAPRVQQPESELVPEREDEDSDAPNGVQQPQSEENTD
jgi:peptidyl-prolyl cis-trans isomerase A (cyclophilin A)